VANPVTAAMIPSEIPAANSPYSWATSTKFQLSEAITLCMGIRPDAYETSLLVLRRRQPLLDAWLEAMNRLGGPSSRVTTVRNIGSEGRPLIQSSDPVIVHPEPMWQ
jgi:hypothetical protein